MSRINVDKNIKVAETLPSDFYKSNKVFGELKEKVFYKSWQFIEHKSVLPVNSNVYPFEFMKDYIEEPLILVKDIQDLVLIVHKQRVYSRYSHELSCS